MTDSDSSRDVTTEPLRAFAAAAARQGIAFEDDHDPGVAVGYFGPRESRTIGSAERARCCTSWELFDRAYAPLKGQTLDDVVQRLQSFFSITPAPSYEDFAAHHRIVMDDEWVVSCDAALWARLTSPVPSTV